MRVTRTSEHDDDPGRWLTRPTPEYQQRSSDRARRLVAVVLVLVAGLGLVSALAQSLAGSSVTGVRLAIVAALGALVIAFLLNRANSRRAAGVLATCVPTIACLVIVATHPTDPGWFAFMALNPLLGRMFLPPQWSIPLAVANLVAVVVAVIAIPDIEDDTAIVAIVFNAIVFVAFLAGLYHTAATERARRRSRDERSRLAETILEGTFGGMAVLRHDLVVEANHTFHEQFRPGEGDVFGRSLGDFFDPAALEEIDSGVRAEPTSAVEVRANRLDGTSFDAEVLVRHTTLDDEDAVVLAVRDVTDRKVAEAAMRSAERTESIARLAAAVAHDANNELLVISSLSGQLAEGPSDVAEQIDGAAERAATLIRRVVFYDGGRGVDEGVVDIPSFIAGSSTTWRHVLGPAIDLKIDTAHVGLAEIEPSRFAQVMLNLVLNARDAINGAGVIDIRTEPVVLDGRPDGPAIDLPPGPYHCVSVRDSGSGIADEHLPYVFDAFFTTKDQGSGIGLAASRESVRDTGGEITIESDSEGTTVAVYLPEPAPAPSASTAASVRNKHCA